MVKRPTTYEEQVEILKSRNITVDDDEFCKEKLGSLNYYRLTAYMLPFKNLATNSYSSVSFEQIYNIYEFDRELRALLLGALEEVEIFIRAKIAYYYAHTYGPVEYLLPKNYNHRHNHIKFMETFETLVYQNRDNEFVKHHRDNKNNTFPIWVSVELFSFGMLSKFYADLPPKDKKRIAKQNFNVGMEQLESWLLCLSVLRNRCAHYMRLYYYCFNKTPKNLNSRKLNFGNTIFDYIQIIKHCYTDADKWENDFVNNLETLILKYSKHIDLQHIGFPRDWNNILINK